jgi:hypothetical protein
MNAKNIKMKRHSDWPKVRVNKGEKKVFMFWPRLSLKKVKSRLHATLRQARVLRGLLRRTKVGDETNQRTINQQLLACRVREEAIHRYMDVA